LGEKLWSRLRIKVKDSSALGGYISSMVAEAKTMMEKQGNNF